jgi:transcriptional regulator with XRE-family HTH domain
MAAMKHIGEALKARRTTLRATLVEIAALAGTTSSGLSKIETGQNMAPLPQLKRFADALGIELWRLVAEAEGAAPEKSLDNESARMLWLFQHASPSGRNMLLGAAQAIALPAGEASTPATPAASQRSTKKARKPRK